MKKYLWLLFLCILPVFLNAQTAMEIEELLDVKAVSYEQASRLVLKAADIQEFSATVSLPDGSEAFNLAAERKWLPKNAAINAEASYEGVSLLIMRAFNIKGGLFYTISKNAHYAYREMVQKEIIQGRSDPKMPLSGEELLFLVDRVIGYMGNDFEFVDNNGNYAGDPPETLTFALPPANTRPMTAERMAEQEALVKEISNQLTEREIADTSVRISDEGVTISLSNIQFAANSAILPDSEKRKLDEIAKMLTALPGRRILVAGHTAEAGTEQDRMMTSMDRARSVATYLVSLRAKRADEIYVQGYGSERPIADNSTPQGMALNRRVEIIILEN
ncbi:MAG: OmpA family protein [Treponema sp.]|nr:OmpA family protein [Treponema sp.]